MRKTVSYALKSVQSFIPLEDGKKGKEIGNREIGNRNREIIVMLAMALKYDNVHDNVQHSVKITLGERNYLCVRSVPLL